MPPPTKLLPHPRLLYGPESHDRVRLSRKLPFLKRAHRQLRRLSNRWVKVPPLTYPRDCHNEHLLRARELQTRVVTLLARWSQTGEDGFREAALVHLRLLDTWQHWSWLAWRQELNEPEAIYDLSYGENAATLAIAYDWLYESLNDRERQELLAIAERWPLASGRIHAREGGAWWYAHPNSNWNTVCTGGFGMLVLAMYEELPDAAELLERVETSFKPFFATLDEYDGGWPEGIGYWNYGLRYAFLYLLSWEHAIGQDHPLLESRAVRRTLEFPVLFCPHGEPCSFGDVNRWRPMPFHYAMTRRLKHDRVRQLIDELAEIDPAARGSWPDVAEWLLVHSGRHLTADLPQKDSYFRLYQGLDWGVLADRWPQPRLYLSLRGGTTQVPHSHRDLLSFNAVFGGEKLISSLGPDSYLDSTFSPRRDELFETGPWSKNTILINGLGITNDSCLSSTEKVGSGDIVGFRLIASEAMGSYRMSSAAEFCGRLVLILERKAFLIVDRVELPHVGLIESRLHSHAKVTVGTKSALIQGDRQQLRIVYTSDAHMLCRKSQTTPTAITTEPATVLRWVTQRQVKMATLVTLLSPGKPPASLQLSSRDDNLHLTVNRGTWNKQLRLSTDLRLRDCD